MIAYIRDYSYSDLVRTKIQSYCAVRVNFQRWGIATCKECEEEEETVEHLPSFLPGPADIRRREMMEREELVEG